MQARHETTQLGFVEGDFPQGLHVCHIFSDDEERNRTLHRFLCAGLKEGERCGCFSDHFQGLALARELEREGCSEADVTRRDALVAASTRSSYFADGQFRPEMMLGQLAAFDVGARQLGFKAARIIGEMTRDIEQMPGGSRLLEYEARVSILLRTHPITTICQYDARTFDGGSIMDVLRAHPLVVMRGAIVQNPFWISPEQLLAECAARQ